MGEITDYAARDEEATRAEQRFLADRILHIEAGTGRVAAQLGAPAPSAERLQALHRARELTAEMHRQVRVRSLEDAIVARLSWLDRVEARQAASDYDPATELNMVALDRRLLQDMLAGWRSGRP
jgi:hypothetical protein